MELISDRLTPFRLRSDGARHEVVVAGIDLTDSVRAVEVVMEAGSPPAVVLHPAPARTLPAALDLLARVHVGVEDEPGPAAARFLAAIDPAELERAALGRLDLDPGPHGLTSAMLLQLVEWAHGRV